MPNTYEQNTAIDITFIVPIYNAEKYLSDCLDSIIRQNVKKEILCINDGSTDNSLNILMSYSERYPDIKIINKENGGVSMARNIGLSLAQGRYIWFVDSDDYLLVNNMSELIILADEHKIDILRGLIYRENNEGNVISIAAASHKVNESYRYQTKYAEFMSSGEYLVKSINNGFTPKIISGFYRTSFVKQNQCYFPDSPVNNAEDEYFEMLIFSNALSATICEVSIPVYFYRNNASSSTKSGLKQLEGSLLIFPMILDLCNQIDKIIMKINKEKSLYYDAQNLLWAVRFIGLRLNFIGCCDIYLSLDENSKDKIKHLITEKNISYLDEYKNMVLACDKGGYYPFIYKEMLHNINYIKYLFNVS